jgi:hypothetical protein
VSASQPPETVFGILIPRGLDGLLLREKRSRHVLRGELTAVAHALQFRRGHVQSRGERSSERRILGQHLLHLAPLERAVLERAREVRDVGGRLLAFLAREFRGGGEDAREIHGVARAQPVILHSAGELRKLVCQGFERKLEVLRDREDLGDDRLLLAQARGDIADARLEEHDVIGGGGEFAHQCDGTRGRGELRKAPGERADDLGVSLMRRDEALGDRDRAQIRSGRTHACRLVEVKLRA